MTTIDPDFLATCLKVVANTIEHEDKPVEVPAETVAFMLQTLELCPDAQAGKYFSDTLKEASS